MFCNHIFSPQRIGEKYDRELLVGEGFGIGVFGVSNVPSSPGRGETWKRVLFLFDG